MGLNIKTIFNLREDLSENIITEEEIDESYNDRKQRKDTLIEMVSAKIDKLTDNQLDKLIEFFTELR